MASSSADGGSAAPWLGFIAGVLIVAVFIFVMMTPRREVAQLDVRTPEINMPDVNINPPQTPAPPRAPAPQQQPSG